MEPFLIDELTVTQDYVHTEQQLPDMIEFVRKGGVFDETTLANWAKKDDDFHSGPMKITIFEDGRPFLQDGHHRGVAILLGGRTHLLPSEYVIEHWSYNDYLEIAPNHSWFTPYDVRTQMRKSDFRDFKQKAKKILKEEGWNQMETFIKNNQNQYTYPRTIYRLREIAEKYKRKCILIEEKDENK